MLLVPVAENQGGYRIILFGGLNAAPHTWKWLERDDDKTHFAPVICKLPPGKYVGFDETKSVHLKLDGIGVEYIEKSSYI